MTKVSMIKNKIDGVSNNENVKQAMIGYFLHLSNYPGDYDGAIKEAAYDLTIDDENEFKVAMRRI
jgi:hypothetical protein